MRVANVGNLRHTLAEAFIGSNATLGVVELPRLAEADSSLDVNGGVVHLVLNLDGSVHLFVFSLFIHDVYRLTYLLVGAVEAFSGDIHRTAAAMAKLREKSNIPVLLLTAKSEDTDKILGLNVGADDYITKPFSNKEMVYRVNAQLRRYFEYNKNASQAERQYGELFISSTYMQAKVGGEVIPLTAKEFKLLDFLTKNENCLFGKQKLIDEVWGLEEYIDENTVAVTVARLREKLEAKGVNHIVTVWGLGYKWQY